MHPCFKTPSYASDYSAKPLLSAKNDPFVKSIHCIWDMMLSKASMR